MMFVLTRAVTCSALFIGFLLVFLPDRILARTGMTPPATVGGWQIGGLILGAAGAALRQTFDGDYEEYCRPVGRWWPRG
jgi:protein-S-isoprenylcysteine O-methyltransferase Ste14